MIFTLPTIMGGVSTKIIFLTSTSGSNQSWTVPGDWNNVSFTIECYGNGGPGANNGATSSGGGGGGGGAGNTGSTGQPGAVGGTGGGGGGGGIGSGTPANGSVGVIVITYTS